MDSLYHTTVEPVLLRECQQGGEETAAANLTTALHRVPKVDLHCHLNGSVSAPLLAHLERLLIHSGAPASGPDRGNGGGKVGDDEAGHTSFFNSQEKRKHNGLTASPADRTGGAAAATPAELMHRCFTVFEAIYTVMTSLAFTRLAVQDVLFASAAENILAMEIRTSMRDGMRRTFRQDVADEEVTKEMYVDTVTKTVEHLLCGGLVDLATGELLSAEASAHVLAWGKASLKHDCTAKDEASEEGAAAQWWQLYENIYCSLLQPESGVSCIQERRRYFLDHILSNLTERMHVRLLLSINRGATEAAAWEAARLTTKTQQRQIMEFHSWCIVHMWGRNGGGTGRDAGIRHSSSLGSRTDASLFPSFLHRRLRQTCWVTGMDLSGNCYKGTYMVLEPALAAARKGGAAVQDSNGTDTSSSDIRVTASITIHAGEKQDPQELHEMVLFAPERWGHLVFTDNTSLSAILAAQQGIELCLTSNLLTGGHSHVVDHHLGGLLQLWESMPESRGGVEEGTNSFPCYVATEAVRLAHREARAMRRCGGPITVSESSETADADSGDTASTFVLPNISFHTDDRGVFGTTLSKELHLASQHPAIGQLCNRLTATVAGVTNGDAASQTPSAATLAHFFWLLERLSLAQVFELPLPVQLLAAALHDSYSCVSEPAAAYEGCALGVLQGAEMGDWRDWESFVRVCNSIAASPVDATTAPSVTPLPSRLSRWEWAWLTKCFDRYYD
ncbi:hypothetical protein NXY56_001186 [Leishmania guyanensis]|uniref:Uncharacterized protein n=1 Tax=Leishmania guyanensis TaxID=5670 RepID=A0A1E1IQM9_LEIGU|nr:hypothetical protein, conserved [Leishmania guyanensis]